MNKIDDGGPAFPGFKKSREWDEDRADYVAQNIPAGGMSLRDWFAGMALQSIINNPNWRDWTPRAIASEAYIYADAMIQTRGNQ